MFNTDNVSQTHTLWPTLWSIWELELREWVFCQNALAQTKKDMGKGKEGISMINFYTVVMIPQLKY